MEMMQRSKGGFTLNGKGLFSTRVQNERKKEGKGNFEDRPKLRLKLSGPRGLGQCFLGFFHR